MVDPGTSRSLPDVGSDIRRRTIRGVRWVVLLNLATVPLSFATNLLLGRISVEALGYYGAIQVFTSMFQALFVLGGAYVFTRLVPPLPREDRFPFLLSYGAVVFALCAGCLALARLFRPGWIDWVLERFGGPSLEVAVALCVSALVWAFSCHFLYGVLEAGHAALTLKMVVVGYFLAAGGAVLLAKERLISEPGAILWQLSLGVYLGAALLGAALVFRTAERRACASWRWLLPRGFWTVVFYTHLETVVSAVYTSLAPLIVLLWLDVAAVGRVHAALRYVLLLNLVPVMLASVLAPGLSALEASGMRADALRRTASAIRACMLFVAPATFAVALFAGDAMAIFGPEFAGHEDVLRMVIPASLASPVVYFGVGLAVALGELRAYLLASLIFIAASVGLTVWLVPLMGQTGAILGAALGAAVQHTVISVLLRRRLAFRVPRRVYAAWGCGVAAAVSAISIDPSRPVALGLLLVFTGLFAWTGGVTRAEVTDLAAHLRGKEHLT